MLFRSIIVIIPVVVEVRLVEGILLERLMPVSYTHLGVAYSTTMKGEVEWFW